MTIFYDHQAFSNQTHGGISRYFAELINGINLSEMDQAYRPWLLSDNIYLPQTGISILSPLPDLIGEKRHSLFRLINNQIDLLNLSRAQIDVIHATYYDPYLLPRLEKNDKKTPLVITFLDMIHEKFAYKFDDLARGRSLMEQKRLMAKKADKLIAISECTKNDMVDLLGVDPAKIDVIHLGNSMIPSISVHRIVSADYILFVGRRSSYKNFNLFLEAVSPILKREKLKLVCAGGDAFTPSEKGLIYYLGVQNLIEQRAVSDYHLTSLYQHAILFIFPSLYEGFGIPILEAFACGCPCIASNSGSLPEVAGDAAIYIDPTDVDSITFAISSLVNSHSLRRDLVAKGRARLSHFSWANTVMQTQHLYHTLNY